MEIPDSLVQEIANYLGLHPYREVAALVAGLQRAANEQGGQNQVEVEKPNK